MIASTLKPIFGDIQDHADAASHYFRRYGTGTGRSNGYADHGAASTQQEQERLFYQHHAKAIQSLLSEDSVHPSVLLQWEPIRDDFDIHQLPQHNVGNVTKNTSKGRKTYYDLISSNNLCSLVRAYQTYRESPVAKPKPHVAWWKQERQPQNERRQQQPTSSKDSHNNHNSNNNDDEDPISLWQDQGCSLETILEYLNHDETIAVMINHNTTAVQALNDHPKLQPLSPIGIWQHQKANADRVELLERVEQLPHHNSPQTHDHTNASSSLLLFLGDHADEARVQSTQDYLTKKFGRKSTDTTAESTSSNTPEEEEDNASKPKASKTTAKQSSQPTTEKDPHSNTRTVYPSYQNPTFSLLEPLQHTQFVLPICKTTRQHYLEEWVGDALALGVIPILEDNDWYRQLTSELPVIWVSHYDNLTPELLQVEWEGILQGHPSTRFNFGAFGGGNSRHNDDDDDDDDDDQYQFHYRQLTQSYWVNRALQQVGAKGEVVQQEQEQEQPAAQEQDKKSKTIVESTNGKAASKKKRKRGKKKKDQPTTTTTTAAGDDEGDQR